jgi:hypothetical protein
MPLMVVAMYCMYDYETHTVRETSGGKRVKGRCLVIRHRIVRQQLEYEYGN